MKKVKTIIIPASNETTQLVEIHVCDFCGYESETSLGSGLRQTMIACTTCGRHICRLRANQCGTPDPDDPTDYPSYYCPICYELRFIKYEEEVIKIQGRHEKEWKDFWDKVKKESLMSHKLHSTK